MSNRGTRAPPLPSAWRSIRPRLASGALALAISSAGTLTLLAPLPGSSQFTAEMLEQANARAQEIEDLKRALNGPDQNMRLATFEIMIQSKKDSIRALALETGPASADRLLQALAFKAAVMGLEQLHFTLTVDETQPEEIQERSRAHLAAAGDQYTINLGYRDRARGISGSAPPDSPTTPRLDLCSPAQPASLSPDVRPASAGGLVGASRRGKACGLARGVRPWVLDPWDRKEIGARARLRRSTQLATRRSENATSR